MTGLARGLERRESRRRAGRNTGARQDPGTAGVRRIEHPRKISLRSVDLRVAAFCAIGARALKLCDVCGKDRAMWAHPLKKHPEKRAYLCFGCGGH